MIFFISYKLDKEVVKLIANWNGRFEI